MRKFLIAIAVMMVSLPSMAQFIRGSVKKNIDPTKIDIVFQPTYSSIAGEYVNYFQFSVAIPLAGNAGVTATALAVNAFQNMGTLTASGPFVEGSELVFNFGYLNPSPPTTNFYVWTANTDFTGVVITFSTANAALVGKMVDMTNSDFGFGGANGNSLYGIVTNTGDKTDFATLFYAIPGQSQLGFTPNPGTGIDDQYVQTIDASGCNAGTVSGTSPLCIGQSATYSSNGDAGGLWSSSNTGVATVNATSGLVTAVSAGTTTITYTVSTGCPSPVSSSKTLTVNPNANAGTVSGTSPLCIGASATYSSNGDAGGTWSSSNTGVATVDATSGVVTAVAAGSTNITYTINSGCGSPASSFQALTVNPNANAGTVSGTSPLCIGQSATYSSTGDAGGTWSSSNTGVATVNATSGVVTALSAGSTIITYTISSGCNSPVSASQSLTVNPNANAGTVSGTSPLCIGASATYSSNGDAGGTWSSSNTGVATVNATSGVVTAVGAGSTVITYTVSTGCNSPVSASKTLTVNPNANAGTVSGTSPLCIGQSATYSSNGDAGGTWSSSNTGVATVNATSGVVTAVSAGSTIITYTVSTGCNSPVSASQALTVDPNANAGTVSGTSPLCIGQSATYSSNGDAGGTWSSSNTGVATVNATSGVVTAVGAGTTNITYTVSTGCNSPVSASQALTVDPNANAGTVSGASPLCIGQSATYSSTGDAGGTWSSSNTGVATVNATSGVVTAVGAGTTSITYTVSTGCNSPVSASKTLTVNPNANAGTVSGTSPLCIGASATYSSNGDAGGTWSSSNTGVATVNATSGLVTALSAGSTIITYTVSTGCNSPVSASKTLTVNPNANAGTVTGTSPLCIGQSATYSSTGDAGGTWSSSNTGVATVNATSGLVTAVSAGSTVITYTVSTGCNSPLSASQALTVNPNANAGTVSGTSPLCAGQSATYSSTGDAGGTWSSSNTGVATVNATSGVVTAVSAGSTIITYTVSGCNGPASSSQALTVNPNANAGTVSGTSPLCIGASATYSSNGDAGGTWSSSNTGVATVNATSGVVTAVSAGSTIITYTISIGCSPVASSKTLTVNPNANAGTVSGPSPLCIEEGFVTYSSTGDAGGTWSSSNTGVATVNATSGVVSPVGPGSTVITYTVSSGCNGPVSASQALTVNANANAGTVSGTSPLCIGATATYTSDGDAGGTWSSSNTGVATVNATSGLVTAVGAGTTSINYTVSGCGGPLTSSKTLTVNPNANAGTVSGTSPLCIGQSATYSSNGDAGGTWSSSNTGVATVNATSGVVTAVGAGSTTITYTVSTGCNSPVSSSKVLTVNPDANAGTVSGTSPLCIGQSATYSSNGDAGGTWSSSNTGVATVNATSGVVTAVGAGSTTITYTVSTGCNSPVTSSKILTVNPNANAGTVSGTSPLCIGQSATYSSTGDAGGTWSSSNTGVATVNATSGVVTAVGAGTTNITYTVSTGCNSPVSASQALTVNPNANAGTVTGTSPLCIGQSATYSSNGDAGGTWSSSNTGVATVNATSGVVTAVGAGSTVITYTVSTGCNSPVSASQPLTVNANANAGTVSGTSPLCIGQSATYSSNGDAGGTWSSSNTSVATVNATSGVVTAVGAGSTIITYTVSGCNGPASASQSLTVDPNANAGTVSGTSPLCIGQTATYTSNGDAGGTWSSSNTSVATVNATSGVVTAVGAGSTNITYTVSTGCNSPVSASQALTVNANANAGTVTGTSPLCIGQSATYSSNGDAGGTWSSSNTGVATVNATSGLVTAVGAGSTVITYTVSTGCNSPVSASQSLTVNPNVSAGTVSGVSPLCIGQSATYSSNGDAGGTWSSSNTGVATVNATSGVVIAVGAGSTIITYTVSGCNGPASSSQSLTVNPNVSAGTVSGVTPICIGETTTYTASGTAGGTWSSSNTGVATVNATSGAVTGVAAGTSTITYTVSGCGPVSSASKLVTVSPNVVAPSAINGATPLCAGATATYTQTGGTAGGTWSSSNTSVATVNATSGLVTAVAAGTTDITYTVNGCGGPVSNFTTLTVVGPYTITASAGPNGSITPSGSVTVPCNGRQTFTMTANSCYHIATVLVDGVNDPAAVTSGSYTFDNVTADHTISVTFALSGPYNIVASAGPNGTIVPSGTTVVACGGSQVYTMTANAGYNINQVLVDGVNNPAAVSSGTYTFTNVQSDHTISVSFASGCTPTTVTISANSNAFCGNLTLTAVPAIPGSYTYQWYRNAVLIAGATSQTYTLTTASPDGNYTVRASQGASCTSAPSPAYVYNKQNTLQSYTILGLDNVELGENNTVLHGSVGNTKSGQEVYIKKNGWVASPGAFVKASKIKVDNPSNVPIRILARVTVTLPTMLYNTTSTSGLSNITISSNQTLNGNWKDVTIKKNVVVTLTGTIFGDINIEDGAQVTFTAPVVNMYKLDMGKSGGSGNITRVKFSTDCIVKVKDEVKVDENCRINSTSKIVVFYVDGDVEVEGKNTHVRASIYAPDDDIKVKGDNSASCYMTGRFIAKEIESDGKNVIWDNFDCANPPAANFTEEPPVYTTTTPQTELPGKYPVEIADKLDVRAYPNPSAHRFTLMLKTPQMNQQVLVRVLDINGKVRQELRGNPGQVFQVGEGLLPGIYIAEVIQGTEKVSVKLVKQ